MRKKELQAKIKEQADEIKIFNAQQADLREKTSQNQKLHQCNADLTDKVNKLNIQVRKQTEADLFFTSAQICLKMLKGESKKAIEPLRLRQEALLRQVAQQQAQSLTPYCGTGLQGSLLGHFI